MDDPCAAGGAKTSTRRIRHLSALSVGWVFAFWVAIVAAEDQRGNPPIPASPGGTASQLLPATDSPAYRAPAVATYPELTWFGGALPLVPAEQIYLATSMNGSTPLPPTDGPLFRLASLQEPADSAPDGPDEPQGNGSAGQEQQKYGHEPVSNTLQFLRNQGVLLDPGSWQFDIGFTYTLFETPFPATTTDTTTGNVTDVAPGTLRRRLLYSPFAFRYGLCKRVQLFGVLPAGYTDTQTSTFGSSITQHQASLGDLTAGANVHLCDAKEDYPDVIATLACTAPTGNYSAPVNTLVPGAALGQGFWALSGQLLMIHRYDPVIVFYGGGYRHLFERSFGGTPFAAGEQINYLTGVGFSINDRVTFSAALQGLYVCNTRVDRATVRGSNLEPISLRFATTISRRCKIFEPFVSIGMTQSAPAASMGMTITYY
jgi:hypothetical protein